MGFNDGSDRLISRLGLTGKNYEDWQPWVSICIYDIYTFLYISYIQKSVYIFCYIYSYIYCIYTLYMKFENDLYICIYTVYMKFWDFVYIHVYIQSWALHNWHIPIFWLKFLHINNDFQICIYDIYTFCIYNVYIHCIWNFQKTCIYVYIHLYMKIVSFVYIVYIYIHAIYTLFVYIIYTYRHPRLKYLQLSQNAPIQIKMRIRKQQILRRDARGNILYWW